MFVLRLIREIGKDWKTFTIATLLLVISSFVEVYIPQVVRYTIDNYVLPKYAIHRETGKFVDITKLNRWEISEKVYPERFFKTPHGYKKPGEIFSLPVEKIYEYRREDLMKIRLMFFILVIMLITRFVSSYGYIYLGNKVAQNISNKLRIRTFKHALNLPLSYFNKTPLGVVLTRLTNDISAITLAYTDGFLIMLKDIFMFVLAVFIMVSISLKLTLLVLLIMPLVLMFSYVFSKIVGRAWRNVRTLIANLNAFLQETIWGLKIVQNLGIYAPMNARFGILNEKLYVAYMKVVYVYGVFMPLISLMSYIATAIIIWYSAEGILKNELTFGSLVAFLSYVDILFQPIVEFGQRLQNLQSAVAGYEKVDGFLKEKVEISSGKSVVYNKTATVIEFDNVSFSYDGKKNAVSNIKLTVMNGEKVALVGKTGSGKSTLLNLMMGFYIPTSGEVKIMGLSTREWDKKLLRSLFAPVMQELTVFSDTMENNITLGYNLDFLKVLKDLNIEYIVHKEYSRLSSGERQLVAIARALAFNRPIIIFDEATSNLDALTELKIQKILKEKFSDKTLIIVAHRLATAMLADRIVVLRDGRIEEMGSHEELINTRGIYYRLYQLQVES